MQKDCSEAPNSKFVIGFGLSSLSRGPHMEEMNTSFVMSGIIAKQVDGFSDECCDEFGRCVSQKTRVCP